MELSPERRDQIRERVLQHFDRHEARRRKVRMLVARASVMLLAGVMLTAILIRRALRD